MISVGSLEYLKQGNDHAAVESSEIASGPSDCPTLSATLVHDSSQRTGFPAVRILGFM
jgi:hypothetical protein